MKKMQKNNLDENKHTIITDKNNEMELCLKNNNEKLSITLTTVNQFPSKKYELEYDIKEFQKHRFFKIFRNIDEIIIELDSKIKEKTTFLEEDDLIIMDIEIGLTVIKEILLEIRKIKKNKDDIIEELMKKNEEMEKTIKDLNIEINKLKETNKNLKISKEEEEKKLKENEIEFNGVLKNEDFELLYNELNEEYNIDNMLNVNIELIKTKLKQILKITDYSNTNKADIFFDLKDKIMDNIF